MLLKIRSEKNSHRLDQLHLSNWRITWTKLTEKATWTTRTDTFCSRMFNQLRNVSNCSTNPEISEWTINLSRSTFGNQRLTWPRRETRRTMPVCNNWSVLSWKKAVRITATKEIIANSKPEATWTTKEVEMETEATSTTEEWIVTEAEVAVEEAKGTTTGAEVSIQTKTWMLKGKTTWVNSHNMATNQ